MDLYQSLVTVNPVTLIAQICNLFLTLAHSGAKQG